MTPEEMIPEENDAQLKRENQDLPNIPASTEKIEHEHEVKKEIKKTSRLHEDGKTDNTEQHSEN